MAKFFIQYKSYIFLFLIALLSLKVFIPQLDGLVDGLSAVRDADPYWIVLSTVVYFFGIPILAFQFMNLALKKIYFKLTLRVELATLFVSKLLPIGLGTISLNAYYLTKKNHTPDQSFTVIAMNSMTSGIAYLFIMGFALIKSDFSLTLPDEFNINSTLLLFILILLIGVIYMLWRSVKLKSRLKKLYTNVKQNLKSYKDRPKSVLIAIICNFAGSMTSIFAIFGSAHAIGVDLSLSSAVLAYTFGNIAATLVPTPGGLGATEAGIYSGLVLAGVDGPSAIIVTLIYRLLTYWLPIIPGYYFFSGLRKDVLADYSIHKNPKSELPV